MAELKKVLDGQKNCETVFPYIKLENHQQLRASIESSFYNVPELDSKLYSVPTINLLEISLDKKKNEQKKPVSTFCFFMRVDDSEYTARLLDMLNEAIRTKRTVKLGKRSSQGMNIFEFQNVIEENISYSHTDYFLNMGMLLPDKIDFASSTLKLFTSERRPFEIPGGWDKDFTGYYISFIAEGSIIVPSEDRQQNIGKSIRSPFNPQRDIIFGDAFLYPLHLEKGRCDNGKDDI